ncbi:MAG: sarcosine oxidase subunit delta [Acidobacteria bacterium]|nr:sarcosine oxidase subunit delta [Acidobacteriota bacterium]
MSFLMDCPNCGERSVYEFQYGGEVKSRPLAGAPRQEWTRYLYWRTNSASVAREWWFHKLGCRVWFQAERNATTNEVKSSYLPGTARARQTSDGGGA